MPRRNQQRFHSMDLGAPLLEDRSRRGRGLLASSSSRHHARAATLSHDFSVDDTSSSSSERQERPRLSKSEIAQWNNDLHAERRLMQMRYSSEAESLQETEQQASAFVNNTIVDTRAGLHLKAGEVSRSMKENPPPTRVQLPWDHDFRDYKRRHHREVCQHTITRTSFCFVAGVL